MKFGTLMQNGNTQNVTDPDFRKKFISGRKCRKYAGKTGFLAFSRDFFISFFWFFAQRCVLTMLKTWSSPIFKKNFSPAENAGSMPEISVFADFHWTFSLYFVIFSCKNISYSITMPTINHGLIVNKTDFCSRNFLKIAGTAHFRRKNGISPISPAVLNIY